MKNPFKLGMQELYGPPEDLFDDMDSVVELKDYPHNYENDDLDVTMKSCDCGNVMPAYYRFCPKCGRQFFTKPVEKQFNPMDNEQQFGIVYAGPDFFDDLDNGPIEDITMIICDNCGQKYSIYADQCPKCGEKNTDADFAWDSKDWE